MKGHRAIRLMLYEYVAGTLDDNRHMLVQRHVDNCPQCAKECAGIRGMLEVLPGQTDPAADLPPAFWEELLNDVTARLPARRRRIAVPAWIAEWWGFFSLPRHQAIAGLATLLALVAIIAGTWLTLRHEPVLEPAVVAPATSSSGQPAVDARLKKYLRTSKALLVELNNMPLREGDPIDLSLERTTSRALLHEARYLKTQPLDGMSAALIADLEKIQTALANTRDQEEVPGVQLIRGGIQDENLLFKIRIAETVFSSIEGRTRHGDR